MQRTARIWLVYTLTDSALLVGILGVCQFMPMLLLTLFAGVFIDRFPKRSVLIITQSIFMVLSFTMALLVYTGVIQYWHILVITTLFGVSQTVDMPARQSFFIELVGKKDVMNAISLNSTIFNLAKIVGPAIAGLVMVKFGIVFCFLVDAVSYIAVIYGLFRIQVENDVSQRIRKHVLQEISEGLQYIRKNETLIVNAFIMMAVCTFAFNSDVIIPVFAKTVLNKGADVYTGLMSATGIGSFIAAIVMATIAKYGIRKDLLIMVAVASSCIEMLLFFAASYPIALIMVAALGFFNMCYLNLSNSIFQVNTLDEYRGRVMSVYAFLNQGSTPVGNLYAGSVMDWFGGIAGFPACGAATILSLIPIFVLKKRTIGLWLKR